jgi:hypothetical protein
VLLQLLLVRGREQGMSQQQQQEGRKGVLLGWRLMVLLGLVGQRSKQQMELLLLQAVLHLLRSQQQVQLEVEVRLLRLEQQLVAEKQQVQQQQQQHL